MRTSTNKTQTQKEQPYFSKTCPVILRNTNNNRTIQGLAMIDDQSNITYIHDSVKRTLQIQPKQVRHVKTSVTTIEGSSQPRTWEEVTGLTVSSLDQSQIIKLPPALIQKAIPSVLHEIPNPELIAKIPEFAYLAPNFPQKKKWSTLVLIGRDCPLAQRQQQFLPSSEKSPIITQTPLGWAMIGQLSPDYPTTNNDTDPTTIELQSSKPTVQAELENTIPNIMSEYRHLQPNKEDEYLGYSQDETTFLQKVVPNIHCQANGMIQLPLPFRQPNPTFTNNQAMARQRTTKTLINMKKKHPQVFESSLKKFPINLDPKDPQYVPVPHQYQYNHDGHANWISLFSVWQKQKARIVFDAAAKTQGVCLNDHLLPGPDRNNSLRGVLLRSRRHPYVVMADIENMFHKIAIPPDQYTYLRFFWYKDNDPRKAIIQYWSKVHLMGLTSSPANANLAVRYAARKQPPIDGQTWIQEDDILTLDQPNRTRIPDHIETILVQQFYVEIYHV